MEKNLCRDDHQTSEHTVSYAESKKERKHQTQREGYWWRRRGKVVPIVGEENRKRMEKLKEGKSGRKKFQFLSGELPCLLMLRLGNNQVLQFCFPKDTASRLQNNKLFAHTPFHTHTDAPFRQIWAHSVVYFQPFIHTKIPGGVLGRRSVSLCLRLFCVDTKMP